MRSNDEKLIAVLCTRTKAQLLRTSVKFRSLYDRDLRKSIKSETSGEEDAIRPSTQQPRSSRAALAQ